VTSLLWGGQRGASASITCGSRRPQPRGPTLLPDVPNDVAGKTVTVQLSPLVSLV
jgi:hypothetical protein